MTALGTIHKIMTENRAALINDNQVPTKNGYRCGEGWIKLNNAYKYLELQQRQLVKRRCRYCGQLLPNQGA